MVRRGFHEEHKNGKRTDIDYNKGMPYIIIHAGTDVLGDTLQDALTCFDE